MDFFTQLFSELSNTDSITILLFLFGAFLIGWLFGRWSKSGTIKELKNNLANKEKENRILQENLGVLQTKFEDQERLLNKTRIQLNEWESTAAQYQAENGNLKADLQQTRSDLIEAQHKNDVFEEKIEDLNDQILGLKVKNNKMTSEIEKDENLYDDLTALQQAFDISQKRIENLEQRLIPIDSDSNIIVSSNGSATEENVPTETVEVYNKETSAPDSMKPGDEGIGQISSEDRAAIARMNLNKAIGQRIAPASKEIKDDLKSIEGIGPFIEQKLNTIGIYTFEQISQLDDALIEDVTNAIQFFPGRIKKDDWVGQAAKRMG